MRRDVGEGTRHPIRASRIDRETAERPYQQRRDNDPLRQADQACEEPAHPRLFGRQELAGAVQEVEEEERERVGQAGIAAPDIEGDGY